MEDVPKELAWVNERSKSDIKKALELLRQSVQKDLEQYKSLSGLQAHYAADLSIVSDLHFNVTRAGTIPKFAVFNRGYDHIEITFSPHSQPPIKATPEFSKAGDCKFRIEGEEGEKLFEWQLRRRALETLLFTS